MFENIDNNIVALFYVAVTLITASFFIFFWKKKLGLGILVAGTFTLALFMALLDPFLHLWDEQQHALVAKHMIEHPFKPMLYTDPVLPYLKSYWVQNHIWLHKQPLFMWQMALSMKIFGTNVLAMRLPSVIMFSLMPLIVFRIGTLLKNETAGFIAAFFMALANFPLELVSGMWHTDHNDMAFMFYLTLSVMCWFEYQNNGKTKWLILLGITAGCAVLVKWLLGLLVYVIWYLVISFQNKMKIWEIKNYLVMIKPFVVSLIVFLPWQIYCLINYPYEWKWEMQAAGKHFNHVVEGHGGSWKYHFDEGMDMLYFPGDLIPFVLLAFLIISFFLISKLPNRLFLLLWVLFIYMFFTVAATKMLGFTVIAMPLILVSFGISIEFLYEKFAKKVKTIFLQAIFLFAIICYPACKFLNPEQMQIMHSDFGYWENYERINEMNELYLITELRKEYGSDKVVIFNSNTTPLGSIQIMFFTDYLAYPQIPNDREIKTVLENDYVPVVLDRGNLSDTTIVDPRLTIFPVTSIYY
ncbi:MAG: glycosyltransferase family 39 protein [Crocinitomicaceae bacterium]|nr:glycosyltransferase family 39 protein [Crocinitomicaceae bacterium]